MSQRVAWKSNIKICACSSEVFTHCPFPDTSRSRRAVRMPMAQNRPAHKSAIGMPARTGPCPGMPVIRHQAAHPLGNLVEARALLIGTVLAKARDTAVHQPGIDLTERLVIDPQA